MNLREAAQQALEALEYFFTYSETNKDEETAQTALTALRAALAEPEQEPMAWMNDGGDLLRNHPEQYGRENENWKSLYTHPPQRKPLTEERIVDIWAYVSIDYDDQINIIEMARAIEAAHGIKQEEA